MYFISQNVENIPYVLVQKYEEIKGFLTLSVSINEKTSFIT